MAGNIFWDKEHASEKGGWQDWQDCMIGHLHYEVMWPMLPLNDELES